MNWATSIKTKLTTKPISIFFNKFNLSQLDDIISIESGSSVHPWSKTQLQESISCLLYTSPSPRDRTRSRMPSSA